MLLATEKSCLLWKYVEVVRVEKEQCWYKLESKQQWRLCGETCLPPVPSLLELSTVS